MIGLLMLAQAAVTVSDDDRTAFVDYRKCILGEIEKAPRDTGIGPALQNARTTCHMDEAATGLDMAGNDFDSQGDSRKRPKFSVEQRLAVMEGELTGEATALFEQKKADFKH